MQNTFKRVFTISICLIFLVSLGHSQSLWKSIEINKIDSPESEIIQYVSDYKAFQVDYNVLFDKLNEAPKEYGKKEGLKMLFPMPNGSLREFEVFYSPIMETELAMKYPAIRSFRIISTDGEKAIGRIGTGHHGFYGSILTNEGRLYIDSYSDSDLINYVSYYTKNYGKTMENLPSCGVSGDNSEKYLEGLEIDPEFNEDEESSNTKKWEGEVGLRTYRVAIACTGEWGTVKGGTVEAALSAVNQSLTKINEIFEAEVAIRLLLVGNNDLLMHLNGATDPYQDPTIGGSLIGQNTAAVGSIIGLNSFDIGHVYTVGCSDVGGIASLASVCGFSKGNGVTCHYSSNIDLISVRVACHEMGHQFAASHTFNNCDEENESSGSAYEPGSGSTIMSYAGGCGPLKNVANGPDSYFHGYNIEQMSIFSREGNGNTCATYIETENNHPVITLPYTDGFYIPLSTPFRLDGTASDAENDDLTYSWEEFDLGPLTLPGMPVLDSPQFVSEEPDGNPERILPQLPKIIANQYDFTEVLPFYNKDMTWRLTVRDNNPQGGGADWKEVQFFATEEAGPFLVMFPNTTENFTAGTQHDFVWDVANTDGEKVNCQYVDLLLSVDGGLTYPHILKSYTPNDGSEVVTIPNAISNFCRLMVRASDNIFFDISNTNSKINEATEPGYSAIALPGYQQLCLPGEALVTINTEQFLGYDEDINFEIIGGLPAGAEASFVDNPVQPGNSTEIVFNSENVTTSGQFDIQMRAIAGLDTIYLSTILELTSSDYSDLAITSPAKGESGLPLVLTFDWVEDTDAESYIFELSDNPSFQNGETVIYEEGITTNSYTIAEPLFKNNIYFWRVTGVNRCGVGFSTALSTFATEALSCKEYVENAVPINLPSAGTPTTILESVIVSNGQVSDVNVRKLKGTHTNFKDLSVKLVSPKGTEVVLFDKRCAGSTSYNGGFDNESPNEISCPISNGSIFKPEGDLSLFNGEDLIGTWQLVIEDGKIGDGGKVNDYILDICSNASLSAPYIVKNNALSLGPAQEQLINQGRLLVEDADNDSDEIIYTLAEIPSFGELKKAGTILGVGDKFKQLDLESNYITYKHTSGSVDPEADKFVFTVDDGEGGWIDLTTFDINVDIASRIEDEQGFTHEVVIYPNPAHDRVNISFKGEEVGNYDLVVTDILGQVVHTKRNLVGQTNSVDLTPFVSGSYFFKLTVENNSKTFKVQVTK